MDWEFVVQWMALRQAVFILKNGVYDLQVTRPDHEGKPRCVSSEVKMNRLSGEGDIPLNEILACIQRIEECTDLHHKMMTDPEYFKLKAFNPPQ